MRFSLGLGLTNACNLSCAHCYRDTGPAQYLTLADVRRVCASLPVRAANLGTGENGLHPEFHAIVDYLQAEGIATSITSATLPIASARFPCKLTGANPLPGTLQNRCQTAQQGSRPWSASASSASASWA